MNRTALRVIAIITALVFVMGALLSTSTLAGSRRITGDGKSLNFHAGERVIGEIISYRKPDGWGKTMYRCRLPKAAKAGKVTTGIIGPNREEWQIAKRKGIPLCKNTLASAGPRRESGDGRWLRFKKGDHVLGFAIELKVWPRGKTHFKCVLTRAQAPGRVNSGVRNPSRFEIEKMKRKCARTSDWRPGFKTESGDSGLVFQRGDWIMAAFIRLVDGTELNGSGNGCWMIAPTDGTLFGGVRNFWPGQNYGLPRC